MLGPPFDALPHLVGRWQGSALKRGGSSVDDDGIPRHLVLLRPRCQRRGTTQPSAPRDAELFGAYTAPGAACGTASLSAARALHGALGHLFPSSVVPSLLAQAAVEYVTDSGLFVGAEGQVRAWMEPCLLPSAAKRASAAVAAPGWVWGPSDVAIHVRLGDILNCHHAAYRPLPMSFYK